MVKFFYISFFFLLIFNNTFSQSERKEDIFYEIFIRSFADADNDGNGDIKGVTAKLDYIQQLGITGIVLMPVNPSPYFDNSAASDFYSIDKSYGTSADFKNFMTEAHKRNIKVIVEFSFNKCSNIHPWFLNARMGKNSKYRDFFLWADTMTINYEAEKWYWPADDKGKAISGQRYYARYGSEMPALNYNNQLLRKEILKIAAFWVKEMGVDGLCVQDPQYIYSEQEKNNEWWKQFSDFVTGVKKDVIIAGDINAYTEVLRGYLKNGIISCYNYSVGEAIVRALANESSVGFLDSILPSFKIFENAVGKMNATFLTRYNHTRIMSEVNGSINKAKMAASILMMLPGTPNLYYGEEIGMLGEKTGRNTCEPFLWDSKEEDKIRPQWLQPVFSKDETMVPLRLQQVDKSSLYNHYLNLIQLRENFPLLQTGSLIPLHLNDYHLLIYQLSDGRQTYTVIHNLSAQKGTIPEKEFTITNNFIYGKRAINYSNGIWEIEPFSTVIFMFR